MFVQIQTADFDLIPRKSLKLNCNRALKAQRYFKGNFNLCTEMHGFNVCTKMQV